MSLSSGLTVGLSVLSSLLVGSILCLVPWTPMWESNSLLWSYPLARPWLLSPFTRGAITGLGLVNLLLALDELRLVLRGSSRER